MGDADDEAGRSPPAGRWQRCGPCLRVVFAPRIALRSACDCEARVVGCAAEGELLEVAEVRDGWARLSEGERLWRCARGEAAAWALVNGHALGLGRLLEPHDPLGPLLPATARDSGAQPRHRPGDSAAAGGPLACFLPCHASSEERVERLAETLATIARQEPGRPARVLVSWSASSPWLRHALRTLLAGAAGRLPSLRAAEQPGRLSQFQHLAACLEGAREPAGEAACDARTWALFSDDDDLWHPQRCTEYIEAIRELGSGAGCVGAASHAHLRFDEKPRARRPEDVEGLLVLGPMVCRRTDAPGGGDLPEYFDFAVPLPALADFLQQTPPRLLASRYCDRRFVTWLTRGWCRGCGDAQRHRAARLPVRWLAPQGWLYFYSRCPEVAEAAGGAYGGGASGAVEVTQQDRDAAAAALARAGAAGGAAGELARGLDAREAALLAAMARRAAEEMVVASGDGPVCAALARGELRRLCRFAARGVYEGRLRRWAAAGRAASEAAQDWAIGLAEDVGLDVCRALEVPVLGPPDSDSGEEDRARGGQGYQAFGVDA